MSRYVRTICCVTFFAFGADSSLYAQPVSGGGMTTVCQFTSGQRAGTTVDFAPYGVQPIPVGSPCTDGQGSNGTAVARTGPNPNPFPNPNPNPFPNPNPNSNTTTICQFTSGQRAGTTVDFAPYGVQPIPVGGPCTDGQGSNGTAVARGTTPNPNPLPNPNPNPFPNPNPNSNTTTICQFTSGQRAGTRFDFAPYGVQPIPVGSPCTDGQGSNGVAVR